MIFRFLVLLLCMAFYAPVSALAEDKSEDSPVEEILPVAPQTEDGFEGVEQNSFGAPTEKSFSSELLSKTRKKKPDSKAKVRSKTKKVTSKTKAAKGKTRVKKKSTAKSKNKKAVRKSAPTRRAKAVKTGKSRGKVTNKKKITKKPVKKTTKKGSGKK